MATSLRADGSRECAPDDRLREAIHLTDITNRWIASSLPLLAMTRSRFPYLPVRSSFILSVDGMFTTFIERAFTNTFEAMLRKHARSCVSHGGHAD